MCAMTTAFELHRVLSDVGGVSRGVCEVDANGGLISVTETHELQRGSDDTGEDLIVEVPAGVVKEPMTRTVPSSTPFLPNRTSVVVSPTWSHEDPFHSQRAQVPW